MDFRPKNIEIDSCTFTLTMYYRINDNNSFFIINIFTKVLSSYKNDVNNKQTIIIYS